ncbi:MAG: ABC transporter permease [Halobacteriaceae archaeon]
MSRARTVFEMGLREYQRSPVLLVLLVFLPAYFILTFTYVMPTRPVPVALPGEGSTPIGMQAVVAVLMTPIATALVGGAGGLFLMQSARSVDSRLALTGLDVPTIVLARGAVLAIAAIVAAAVSTTVLAVTHVPDNPGWFLAATIVVGLMYGAIGALVGLVLNRLAGIYVLMFGPLLDMFLAQSPLTTDAHAIAPYLPSHYPMQVVFDAAFTATVDPTNLGLALAYLAAVAVLAILAFARVIRGT